MNELERAAKKSCILISGQEDILRSRALGQLFSLLEILPDDFDVQTFDAQSSSPLDWIGAAATIPFLAPKRVVVVRHLLQCEPPKESKDKKKIFSFLPETSLLILVADPVGGSDDKRSRAKTFGANWQKLVTASEGAVLNYDPDPKRSREGIAAEAVAKNVTISDRALDTLIEMTGGSLSRSIEEFEKLALFVGNSVTINERHVEAIVVPSREWNVFKLTDAIFEKRHGEALRQLRAMIGNGTHAETAAFSQILPQVSRLIKLIWQARVMLDMGTSLSQPSAAFSALLPNKPNLLQLAPFQQTKVVNLARQSNLDGISLALKVIADTDAKLKGSLPSFSASDSLEMMVFDLSSAMR